ncbi:ABC transporter permease [Bacillus paralicheniformis]|uniref:ABC transporter permease n=2 Tax=Bacillus paralicheniformis TaxID=1648923 RepID=UPI0022448CD0|nr:ABC transporter permease [Bacillus paralicheniformis]MEC1023361.1 ABC transporter permease [Bacillus paralicheniformis]MEC1027812.1 ABC transporter permease [Bacillus paralicheniformis]MEC1035397.1 ABC transporter permease [Bacillus paralicheniformis]MEC1052086.1 ABC transporter permease [Bacillus paralicheniformis]MEC1059638.1 ABC transporter permease [Bacillus paralicheniformis]
MNFFKRAFWSMKAKKGKTLLQLFVFTMICVLVLTGITIQSAAVKSSELAREQLGGSVTLKVDREKMMKEQQESGERKRFESTPVSVKSAEKLASLDYVKSYNYISSTSALADNFDPIESGDENSTDSNSEQPAGPGGNEQGGRQMMQADVSIEGVTSTALVDEFSDGTSKITEGRALTKDDVNKKVAVIEETLAEENDLKVGDTIKVKASSDEATTIKLKIVGIYQTTSSGDNQAQNFAFLNPYNKIYTPYTAASALKGDDYQNAIDEAVYNIDDASNIDAFIAAAKKTGIDLDTFTLDANDQLYQQMVGPIENVASFSKNVVYLVTIAGAVIHGLIVMMSIRERKYEMGVLMAIGEKRWKLVGQFLTEILMIAVLAIGISALTGSLIAGQIGNQLLSQQIEQTSTSQSAGGMIGPSGGGFFGQRTAQVSAIDQLDIQVSFGDLMALGGIGLLIALFATLLPSISVLRLHPKTILTKQE